jgi:hypothetical protein
MMLTCCGAGLDLLDDLTKRVSGECRPHKQAPVASRSATGGAAAAAKAAILAAAIAVAAAAAAVAAGEWGVQATQAGSRCIKVINR